MQTQVTSGTALLDDSLANGAATNNTEILRAVNLRKVYRSGDQEIVPLDGINLEVIRGEMVAIVGPSGTGKSTLLHLLAALDTPTSGAVYFAGDSLHDLTEKNVAEYRNRAVGFVWQRHHLLPDFTAAENVAMPLLVRGTSLAQALRTAKEWLGEVGLADRAGQRGGQLSGGEQQRVAIARALVNGPSLLVADEPTGDLDQKSAEDVFELMHRLHQSHRLTSILATHNLSLARRADRALILERGKLAPAQVLLAQPAPLSFTADVASQTLENLGCPVFERYTEKARRVIFFARYEASQYGSPYIETEHLLLGLLREDKQLANRFLRTHGSIDSIRKEIESRITVRERISTSVEVPLSQECKRILNFAAEEAERLGNKHVGTEHLLLGVLREEKSFGAEILQERGLRLAAVREELQRSAGEKVPVNRPKEASLLSEFSRDVTQAAIEGPLAPLVGRDRELERAIQILCRRTKNNPVLIGEPGVGKTAIVEGLAQRISDGDVPPFLADKRILSLDLSLIVAGTKYRGQFEERLKTIMKELMESQNAIVFIDELHTLVGAGSAEGSLDAANILKPALSRGEIQCIGATTPGEYRKSVEKDRSLERRFQAVKVGAPNEEEAIRVLQGVRDRYEKFHAVSYTDEAIQYAVYLSNRYIPDRFLPDKAIDLIDESGARVKLRQATLPDEVAEVQKRVKFITHRMETAIANHEFEKARFYSEEERKEKENLRAVRERLKIDDASTGIVTREDIEEVVSRWTGVTVTSIKEDEQQKLLRIEIELHKRVISQDKAIRALARAIRRSRAGLKAPGGPGGVFLFLGPTGVGKTEVARRLAEFLFGSEKSLVRFDMSE